MSLKLRMVGIIVENMMEAVEFYRRLGIDISDETVNPYHIEVKNGYADIFSQQ
ncbi:MAG: hypothetical protein AAFU54_21310 [Chloroflexota bacterium]